MNVYVSSKQRDVIVTASASMGIPLCKVVESLVVECIADAPEIAMGASDRKSGVITGCKLPAGITGSSAGRILDRLMSQKRLYLAKDPTPREEVKEKVLDYQSTGDYLRDPHPPERPTGDLLQDPTNDGSRLDQYTWADSPSDQKIHAPRKTNPV